MKILIAIAFCLFAFAAQGQIITTVAGTGTAGYTGDGENCKLADLKSPNDAVFDKYGNMYLCDAGNSVIRKINTFGNIITVAGTGVSGYSGDNGQATLAMLKNPVGVAIDSVGNIYIATGGDHRIRKVNTAGIISTIAGTGTFGYNGDNIPATSAQLFYPYVGAVDKYGNIYFGDYDNHRVRKISATGIITTVAGDGTNTDGASGVQATATGLGGPGWTAISPNGDIYIPDNGFKKIRKINAAGIMTTFAGGGTGGDGGQATNASFTLPNGVAFDNNGNVYISDLGSSVVRKVNSAGIITTIGGTGVAGYSGDGGQATAAQMMPNTVTTDIYGNVYIADAQNNRIRRITYNTVGVNELNNTAPEVNLYPNPAHDVLTINAGSTEMEHVRVLNAIGQVVAEQSVNEHEMTLNVKDLPAGVYFVHVGGVYVGRFVKE